MSKPAVLTGLRFGRLTAVSLSEQRNSYGKRLWLCKCDCGGEKLVSVALLRRGATRSCGCLCDNTPVQPHQRYGKLTVLSRAENIGRVVVFLCRCDCGMERVIPASSLARGRIVSCGCAPGRYPRDITGSKFGLLTALFPTERRMEGSVVWACRCDCGRAVFRSVKHLIQGGNRANCGCLARDIALEGLNASGLLEGTRISQLESKVLYKTNKTGVRGVYFDNRKQRYVATIGFKGRNKRLGSYHTLDEARKSRERAEEELYLPFLAQHCGQPLTAAEPEYTQAVILHPPHPALRR